MEHQPEIGASYGALAQVMIINRLSFDPQPLYTLHEWAEKWRRFALHKRPDGTALAWRSNEKVQRTSECRTNLRFHQKSGPDSSALAAFASATGWLDLADHAGCPDCNPPRSSLPKTAPYSKANSGYSGHFATKPYLIGAENRWVTVVLSR